MISDGLQMSQSFAADKRTQNEAEMTSAGTFLLYASACGLFSINCCNTLIVKQDKMTHSKETYWEIKKMNWDKCEKIQNTN